MISSTDIFLLLPTNSNICQITVLYLPYASPDYANLSHTLSVPFPFPWKNCSLFSFSLFSSLPSVIPLSFSALYLCILFLQSFFFFNLALLYLCDDVKKRNA